MVTIRSDTSLPSHDQLSEEPEAATHCTSTVSPSGPRMVTTHQAGAEREARVRGTASASSSAPSSPSGRNVEVSAAQDLTGSAATGRSPKVPV